MSTPPPLRLTVYPDRVELRMTARHMHTKEGVGPYREYAGQILLDGPLKRAAPAAACEVLIRSALATLRVLETGDCREGDALLTEAHSGAPDVVR